MQLPALVTGWRALFLALVLLGMFLDVRDRRVPNWLVLTMVLVSAIGAWSGAALTTSVGEVALGGALGLALWLPFWLLGLLGAGDVKFFAAGSCWIGASLGWRCALLAALLGGLMSLMLLIAHRGLGPAIRFLGFTAAHLRDTVRAADVSAVAGTSRTFPYAVPMGLTLIGAAVFPNAVRAAILP